MDSLSFREQNRMIVTIKNYTPSPLAKLEQRITLG